MWLQPNFNISNNVKFSAKDNKQVSLEDKYALNSHLGVFDILLNKITGSKRKSLEAIESYEWGVINKQDLHKQLNRRYEARKESSEVLTDTIVSIAAFGAYKQIKKFAPVAELFKKGFGKKATAIALGASVLTGAVLKPILSALDGLGAEKNERKKRPSFIRNVLAGAVNGVASPLLTVSSLFLTIPALLGINSGFRYIISNKQERSLGNYLQLQADNALIHLVGSGVAVGLFALRGKMNIKMWEEACNKAKANHQELKPFINPYKQSFNYEKLFSAQSEELQRDLSNIAFTLLQNPTENKIIESNILLAKFLQMVPDAKIDSIKIEGVEVPENIRQVIKNLKGACPASHTPDEILSILSKTFNKKYSLVKETPLGVGTIAETYLAKNNQTGEEVVIKFLKKGMSKEKIEADRQQVLDLLQKSSISADKNQLIYYQKYVNTMFDAWVKETDLSLEMDAAHLMSANAKKFNVVKPIEVKDNIYVMEKAKGVPLNKLDEELQRRNMQLTPEQIRSIVMNYNKVFVEQLISIPRDGRKIVQADPNSANIFIDLDNLSKPFTFLDLGNVLYYDNPRAISNGFSHLDYIFGNSAGIAKANLEGAILPEGLTKEKALEKLVNELNTHIFNNETKLPVPQVINDFCCDVMRDMKIVSDAANANLIKAETTYMSNMFELRDKLQSGLVREGRNRNDFNKCVKQTLEEMKATGDFGKLVHCILSELGNSVKNASRNGRKQAMQELKGRLKFIEENKEKALSTFYGLIG